MNITESDFTRVNNNANGNPRYVLHFLNLVPSDIDSVFNLSIDGKYSYALGVAKQFGGKKFHNKQYGGGIVFSTYNLADLIKKLNNLK